MTTTDRTLLERWIRLRDAEAFNEIVSRHAGLVYGVCKRLLRNDADAEDVAQGCFLKLARSASPPRSSILGWLHAVATRGAIDFLRARARRHEREKVFAEEQARQRSTGPALQEFQEHVDACIAQLPDELQAVIVAHFLERRTHEEVAAALGVSRQTVSHRIQHGIERLRFHLRRRGVIVSGAGLASCLGQSCLEAAPATLLAALGRLALGGPSILAAPAPAAALSLMAKVGGLIMAKKLLISGIVATVLLLVTGWIAVRSVSGPPARLASSAGASRPPGMDAAATGSGTAARLPAAPVRAELAAGAEAATVRGEAIAGRILDVEGRPVAGARVAAAVPAERPEKLAEADTDADGRFRLEPAGGDDAVVYAFKEGVGLGAAAGAAPLEITLEPLCEVGGKIYDRDSGEGIAGLQVRFVRSSSAGASPEVAQVHFVAGKLFPELHGENRAVPTDEGGHYLFRSVSPLRHRFEFDPDSSEYVLPGFRLDDSLPEVLLDPGERRAGLDFALQRGGAIAGTVFGPDGKGLPEARLQVLTSYAAPSRRHLKCARDGSYRLIGLAPNATYVISASHDGMPPGESPTVPMPTAAAIEGVDIHLARGHAIRGRFVDDLGQPVARLSVYLSKLSESDRMVSGYGDTVTGDDGSFAYGSVAPGKHALWPSTSLHRTDELLAFTMPADRDLPDLEFVLRRKAPGFISGRVVDHLGQPIPGFPVSAGDGLKAVSRVTTGEDGAFRLEGLGDVPAYTVTAYSGEYWSARQLTIPVNSTDVTIVAIKRGRILGRIIETGTQKPIENFEVRAVFIRTEPGGGENRFHLKWTPFDSPAGEFVIERAEPVDCEVQVRAEGYIETKSARFAIPPGETAGEVVIALSRGTPVRGTVLDAETGAPVPGVLVRAHQHDAFFPALLQEGTPSYAPRGVWKLTMSGADGSFELGGLAAGETVHLAAWKDGYGPAMRTGVVAGGRGAAVRIPLSRAATLVIAARLRPAAGRKYEFHAFHRDEKPWRAAFRGGAEIEGPGTVEIAGLPPGAYRLAVCSVSQDGASASRRLLGEEWLKVAPGERREVSFDLEELAERFASVSVKVVGQSDPAGVRLYVHSADDPEEVYAYGPMPPGSDGRFHFTGLPAGKYVIVAPPAGARLPVEVGDGEHLNVEFPAN